MSLWSQQRKLLYASIFIIIVIVVVGIPTFFVVYEAPSCVDKKQNQGEQGVDCGGPCRNLCQMKQVNPVVVWKQKFRLAEGVYSVAAYLENPNLNAEAFDVPYSFKFYDDKAIFMAERRGKVYIPPHKTVVVYEGNIQTRAKVPAFVDFSFTAPPYWREKTDKEPDLVVVEKVLSRETTSPRIEAVVENRALVDVGSVEVIGLVYDGNGNVYGVARTYLDGIASKQKEKAVITWPAPFTTTISRVEVITKILPL